MTKAFHEIRDPIHVFIRLDSKERKALDSPPFQRLRNIHQLALTYLVYPGATHKRFEHSLGVMELASRVYDIVTHESHLSDEVKEMIPDLSASFDREYWKRAIRMAALFHDVGHLPFSHAAEEELLPDGWTHERISAEYIRSSEMGSIWKDMKLNPDDIVKLALGPDKAPDLKFTPMESLFSEIIVGDAFGVDRMDYLLRDSHHIGVAYGRFDHHRLIDTLRILPQSPPDSSSKMLEPSLGTEHGGLQSAEALLMARYLMYSQVYFHPARRIYDIHLKEFLKEWLPGKLFSTDISEHLKLTDNEVNAGLLEASLNIGSSSHEFSKRITLRKHFKVIYEKPPKDKKVNSEAGEAVFNKLAEKFGKENFRHDRYSQKGGAPDFPVLMRDGELASSISASRTLENIPLVDIDFVFANSEVKEEAKIWLKDHKEEIIQIKEESNND